MPLAPNAIAISMMPHVNTLGSLMLRLLTCTVRVNVQVRAGAAAAASYPGGHNLRPVGQFPPCGGGAAGPAGVPPTRREQHRGRPGPAPPGDRLPHPSARPVTTALLDRVLLVLKHPCSYVGWGLQ